MEDFACRAILKEKNDNSMVEVVQQKISPTTPLTKKLKGENEPLQCIDDNNVLKKRNTVNAENNSPDELKVNTVNSPSPLPDIVNLLPTISVNQSTNQNIKQTQITHNKTEQCLKIHVPSGPSSSISSDDELFVECETYSITDKNQQTKNGIISLPSCENDENVSAPEVNIKEIDSNINNITNWNNVISSLSSDNIENLENSKIDLDISPQNLNICLSTTHNNNIEHEKNKTDNNINDIQLMEQQNNNHVSQNIKVLSLKEIIHQQIMENDNSTFDTTMDYSITESNNTFGLSEQIANLQLSNNSNSLNLTVIENKNPDTMEINLNKTVDNIKSNESLEEAVDKLTENKYLNNINLSTDIEMASDNNFDSDIEMASLTSQQGDENQNSIEPPTETQVSEKKELILDNCPNLIPKENLTKLESNDKLETDHQFHNLNQTSTLSEADIIPIISENCQDITINTHSQQQQETTEVLPQEISKSIDEDDFKNYNLNVTATVEEIINSNNNINIVNNETFQKTNLNITQDIEQSIVSDPINIVQDNNINSDVNNIINNNNQLNKNSDTEDGIKNLNLNLTIDISETLNDSKITISKKSPINLETIYESDMRVSNSGKSQNLPLSKIIQKSESMNELNKTHILNSGQNSPNLNFVDSNSQGNLNTTFAASVEALNSTINIPIPKNSNLPIISSVNDEKIHTSNENQNFEFKEDDEFQTNGLILNPWDFDFLLTKGNNNNNNIQVPRSSLLLKFDPLLGKPQIAQQQNQQEFLQQQNQGLHLQQQKLNQEFSPLQSVTSSSAQGRLTPAVEEEEYIDIISTKTPLVDIVDKKENLIVNITENQLQTIKTKHLEVSNNTMSIDVVRDMKTENNIISADNDNSTDIKYDIKMEDLEKKIQNEVLKRTEEIGKKLKEVEQREEALLRRITEKDKTTAKMGSVIEAYEKAIAEMIAEKEEITHNYERQLAEIKSERDLNYQHLASLESTFADLHVKYERCKQITSKLKANEEESCTARKQLLENLRLQEQRYDKMKNHAIQQLEIANNKLEFLIKNHSSEITKLKALLKKEEISKGSLTEQLNQKTRENDELVKICDELINGQGS